MRFSSLRGKGRRTGADPARRPSQQILLEFQLGSVAADLLGQGFHGAGRIRSGKNDLLKRRGPFGGRLDEVRLRSELDGRIRNGFGKGVVVSGNLGDLVLEFLVVPYRLARRV